MTTDYKSKRVCAKCGKNIKFYDDYIIDYRDKNSKYCGKPICGECDGEVSERV